MLIPRVLHLSPGRLILISFLFVICAGVGLLSLSCAQVSPIPLFDVLFTVTSSTCVTGLATVPISSYTIFGKCVILGLIQIGGLGLMTLSFFLMSLFLNFGMEAKFMAGQILEFEMWGKIRNFLGLIVGITFFTELIGAFFLYGTFRQTMGSDEAIFYALFHSVSSFCNAGISLYGDSLVSFNQHYSFLAVISFLSFAGGIGFFVWYELLNVFNRWIYPPEHRKVHSFSLHTKIVLVASAFLVIFGAVLIWILERNHSLKDMSLLGGIVNSIFMSVTLRSTGFDTIHFAHAELPMIFITLFFIFIGASPCSTGSGIKTTTFVLFVATLSSIMQGKSVVEINGRTLPTDQVYKALAIISLGAVWICLTTFFLLLTDKNVGFIDLFFEAASAFCTSGLSTGITPQISQIGKSILMMSMIIGRIGSLTLVLALKRRQNKQLFRYPEERILIG